MFQVVVVGADRSATSKRAVDAAAQSAALDGGTLHIVTVYGPTDYSTAGLPVAFKTLSRDGEIDALLQVHTLAAAKHGAQVTAYARTGDPAEAIVRLADELDDNLIVVGNRSMRGVRRVLGSVPNSVAHQANCSVAVINTTS